MKYKVGDRVRVFGQGTTLGEVVGLFRFGQFPYTVRFSDYDVFCREEQVLPRRKECTTIQRQ